MRCIRCGGDIQNVPEHLATLAEWLCKECSNQAPRNIALDVSERPERKQMAARRTRKAA